MADLVFRSTTRGGRDFFEVTDDGMAYGGKDRYNIKTDESMNYVDTVDEVLAELVFDGAWRINYDKIEVDELGIGDEYKEIVKLIRSKYNWLYNLSKNSKGRQFYFDIGRYFKQELKKGTDYGKIFDKIDGVIEKNNNFEESKKIDRKSIKENKTMKRMTEKEESVIDKIQDLIDDTDDLSSISFDMDESDISSADDVFEYIEDRINEIEVIYYDNAMKILSKYDPSLRESLEYASDLGYDCKDLNSELLATIACQEWARQDLDDIRDDIEEVVDEWLESDEDDE